MKIAVFQMSASLNGIDSRLKAMEENLQSASSDGASLVVFPELATCGYEFGNDMFGTEEAKREDTIDRLKSMSGTWGTAIVIGHPFFEGDSTFNSALFIKPDGHITRHDKVHLYGEYEKRLFVPGQNPPPIVEYGGIRFGMLICFEVEFPERVRELALQGAEVIVVPTALFKTPANKFIAQKMVPVRAFENQCFVVYANHAGKGHLETFQGCSCIAAPDGNLMSSATAGEPKLLIGEILPSDYAEGKLENPYLDELMCQSQN